MSRSLIVLADDLTGAGDAAAPFAALGWPVTVRLAAPSGPALAGPPAGVLVVDLDCRHRPVPLPPVRPGDRLLVKVDSLARGRSAELVVALAAHLGVPVLCCPAWPDAGRTVRDGWIVEDGAPVADWAAALTAAGAKVRRVPAAEARAALAGAGPGEVVLADAADEYDLRLVLPPETGRDRLTSGAGGAVLLAGAAGLAAAIATAWGPHPAWAEGAGGPGPDGAARGPVPPVARGPVLTVAASLHPRTRRQLAELGELPGVVTLEIDPGDPSATVRHAREALADGLDVAVATPPAVVEDPGVGGRLVGPLGALVPLAGTTVATGGVCARALLDGAGVTELRDPWPVGTGLTAYRSGENNMIITKPGSLGDDACLARVVRTARLGPPPHGEARADSKGTLRA
ncbi:hypothetical protein [Nonomuraea sp. NPDC046570]|uniref:four-carbon acid sugar kinase family protein n=1 Tax=Nonomuraea sp. NPDC046570 TaxID=3155255 RepID=UPI0034021823